MSLHSLSIKSIFLKNHVFEFLLKLFIWFIIEIFYQNFYYNFYFNFHWFFSCDWLEGSAESSVPRLWRRNSLRRDWTRTRSRGKSHQPLLRKQPLNHRARQISSHNIFFGSKQNLSRRKVAILKIIVGQNFKPRPPRKYRQFKLYRKKTRKFFKFCWRELDNKTVD